MDDDPADLGPDDDAASRALGYRPDTPMEALMSVAPQEPIERSRMEALALRETLVDAIDELPERDRWIFDALMVEGLSIRVVARQLALSKSFVHRERDRILRTLRGRLQGEPIVAAYLEEMA